tara:strand:+ start:11556 stop:13205 length:1650 start_codon:yes stop_codon:yes gene_type:complete
MGYIGQSPQIAQSTYQSIDDISSSFNGSTTSFALQVGGVSPVPFPIASENCLISVGGVIQEPDGTGTNGFQLTGTNIVFSAAPASGQSFFGVILAGADYVTAGHAFPDGDAGTPSITFNQDLDTGLFRGGTGITSVSSNNNKIADFGPTAIVFNEDGDDVDFRVEGDTKANLFVVDAGNDKITLDGDLEPTTIHGNTFPTAGTLSNRNLFINGEHKIDQRNEGSAVSLSSTQKFITDRWASKIQGGAATGQQVTDVPSGKGFARSFKFDVTTADTSLGSNDEIWFQQRIEAQNLTRLRYGTSEAQSITVSFWVKSALTGDFGFFIYQSDATRAYQTTYNIATANTWEYKTITIPGDTSGTINDDFGTGFEIRWYLGIGSSKGGSSNQNAWGSNATNRHPTSTNLMASTSNDWLITGIQLELGEKATPYEHLNVSDELDKCYRYCQRYGGGRIAMGIWVNNSGGDRAIINHHLHTPMRATPAIDAVTNGNLLVEDVAWYSVTSTPTIQGESNVRMAVFTVITSTTGVVTSSGQTPAVWGNGADVTLEAEL